MRPLLFLFCVIFCLDIAAQVSQFYVQRLYNDTPKDLQIALIVGNGDEWIVKGWLTIESKTSLKIREERGKRIFYYAKSTPYDYNGHTFESIGKRNWRDQRTIITVPINDYSDFSYNGSEAESFFREVPFVELASELTIYQKDIQSKRGIQLAQEFLAKKIAEENNKDFQYEYSRNLSYEISDFSQVQKPSYDESYEEEALFQVFCNQELIATHTIIKKKQTVGMMSGHMMYSISGILFFSTYDTRGITKRLLLKYSDTCN